jgi:hypothetical protein
MQPANETQDMVIEGASSIIVEPMPILSGAISGSTQRDMPDSITESAPAEQTGTHPATERIALMFTQYLRGAIRTQDDTAVISVTLYSQLPYGVLSLTILPNKVHWLANKLFDANIEVEGELRYLVLANGCRLVPRPEITLEGAQGGALLEVFGEWVTRGIEANEIRIKEVRQGILASCVTMRLTGNSKEDAYLCVSMNWTDLLQIYHALF